MINNMVFSIDDVFMPFTKVIDFMRNFNLTIGSVSFSFFDFCIVALALDIVVTSLVRFWND